MQGKKQFTPQLFYSIGIDELVAQNNFYRRLNAALDLHFVYQATAKYYGAEGQQSIRPSSVFQDPVGWLFKPYQQRPSSAVLLCRQFKYSFVFGLPFR